MCMILKRIVEIGIGLMVATAARAESPNNVLAQLGIRGVTDRAVTNTVNGTNVYYGYLFKAGTSGTLPANCIEVSSNSYAVKLSSVYYVDGQRGSDASNLCDGAIQRPYRTLAGAVSNTLNGTYLLTASNYAGFATPAGCSNVTLIALQPGHAVLTSKINSTNGSALILTAVDMVLDEVVQNTYHDLNVNLYGHTVVNGNIHLGAVGANSLLVSLDPTVTLNSPLPITATPILNADGRQVNYTVTNAADWATGEPSNVVAALEYLAARGYVAKGTTNGQMLYWSQDRYSMIPTGRTDQVLYGGTAPGWGNTTATFTNNGIPADFVSATDNVYNVGAPANQWKDGYFVAGHFSNSLQVAGNAVLTNLPRYSLQYTSLTNLVVAPMDQTEVVVAMTNNVIVYPLPTNDIVDGRTLKWRFWGSNGDYTVTWPTNTFRIPSSSSMTNVNTVSNGAISIFATEYVAARTNWLMETYVWGY